MAGDEDRHEQAEHAQGDRLGQRRPPKLHVEQDARQYADQAKPGLPEAKQPFGADFPMDYTPSIGNENFGWSGCNDDCNTNKFNRLHHRLTFRVGNVVAVVYIWGENQSTSINQIQFYGNSMKGRIK